ncbi:MAG: DUF4339 domain-containing protein [Planctomycetia bacterium]|nr:DUF4339 domain-containing protein [Planctomycetia bacterium]
MAKWYCKMGDLEVGPVTAQKLKELAEAKRITPDDVVRRDIDTDWTPARNVKGLFPEKPAIPVGVAVSSSTSDDTIPVAQAIPVAKATKTKATKATAVPVPPVVEPVESDVLSFGFDTATHPSHGKTGKTASKTTTKVANAKKKETPADDTDTDGEKKPLTKKEQQKRNFIIMASVTGGVILLAILILVIVSCSGSDKPKDAEGGTSAEVAVTENGENAEEKADSEADADADADPDADTEKGGDDTEGDENADAEKAEGDAESDSESATGIMPKEWEELGYLCPYEDGKGKSCTFGSMKIFVKKIEVKKLVDYNPKTRVKNKQREYCFIKIEVENADKDGKLLDVPGWGAKGSAVQLFDENENSYKPQRITVDDQADSSMQIAEGERFTDILVFNPPRLESVEFLRLVIPALKKGEDDGLIFIPSEVFKPKKEEKDGENVENGENADSEEGEENAEGAEDDENAETTEPDAQNDNALTDESLSTDNAPAASADGKPEPGGLVDELDKTPPPVDAESKELDAAEGMPINALNDPALE